MISRRQSPTTRPITVSAIRSAPLSDRTRWRWAYVVSSVVGVLALLASLAGLLIDGVYGESGSTAEMFRGYDLVTLVFVVPALMLSQLQARRGSVRAQLIWVGMLAYLVYTYAYYLLGVSGEPQMADVRAAGTQGPQLARLERVRPGLRGQANRACRPCQQSAE